MQALAADLQSAGGLGLVSLGSAQGRVHLLLAGIPRGSDNPSDGRSGAASRVTREARSGWPQSERCSRAGNSAAFCWPQAGQATRGLRSVLR